MNKDLKILIGIIFILLVFILIKNYNDNLLIAKGEYTVGTIENIKTRSKGSLSCDYYYYYYGKKYSSSCSIGNPNIKNNNYFVLFNPENPQESRILLTIKVPDSIKISKDFSGWKKLPIEVSDKEIEEDLKKDSSIW